MTTPDLETSPAGEPESTSQAVTAAPVPWWRRVPRIAWVLAAVAVVAAVIVVVVINIATARNPFEAAVEECGLGNNNYVSVRDDGQTLVVDSAGEDGEGINVSKFACLAIALDVPDSTIARMDSTRALDGVQTDEFDGIEVQWSYHPDNGLDAIFTR